MVHGPESRTSRIDSPPLRRWPGCCPNSPKLEIIPKESHNPYLMSEDTTQNFPNDVSRLILARLDSIDRRLDGMDQSLDSMDQRLEKLEIRAYDTKPIWERALAELTELSKR